MADVELAWSILRGPSVEVVLTWQDSAASRLTLFGRDIKQVVLLHANAHGEVGVTRHRVQLEGHADPDPGPRPFRLVSPARCVRLPLRAGGSAPAGL